VFELSPAGGGGWTETILHDFQPADGNGPSTGLLLAADGTLFGTAEGGTVGGKFCSVLDDCGTVFALSPPGSQGGFWQFSVLYSFPGNGYRGSFPGGPLISDARGDLFGITGNYGGGAKQQANGTVFRLSPPNAQKQAWHLRTLHAFTTDGAYPQGPVLAGAHGVLYGTTLQAGVGSKGGGVVYALTPPASKGAPWQETALFTFPGVKDGSMPLAGVIADPDGALYGTTSTGGSPACDVPFCGTVFRVAPP
jgi:hypothetical protein